MRKLVGRPIFWIMVVIVAAVLAALLGACGRTAAPAQQPQACESHIGLDGRWYDTDGEVVDEDPCDGVDAKRSKSPSAKPRVSSAPKKSTAPAPRVTRR